MTQELKIRKGRPEDIHGISYVYQDSIQKLCSDDYSKEIIELWGNSTPPESRLDAIKNESLWVAEVDGEICGFMVSVSGEIVSLFVGSKFSGIGVGKSLGNLGVSIASENYTKFVKIESTLTAAPFYRKFGFKEIGSGYFTHGDHDIKIPVVNMILEVAETPS